MLSTEHDPCFAHTIQLVVKDGLKDAGQLNKVLGKVSNLVAHVRRSCVATKALEAENRLQACNATRWNSQIVMIKSVLNISDDKLAKVESLHQLSTHDRILLKDMVDILAPFQQATDFAQKQNSISGSGVIPCVVGLECQLKSLISKYNSKMLKTLRSSVERRLKPYTTKSCYRLATMLDPRFKLLWCTTTSEKSDAIEELKMMVGKDKAVIKEQPKIEHQSNSDQSTLELFSFMDAPVQTTQTTSDDEVDKYVSEPVLPKSADVLSYWKTNEHKYKHLAKIAQQYLAIPASSAPVERLFSIAGKVFRPDRCALTEKNFEKLMFIKCNKGN